MNFGIPLNEYDNLRFDTDLKHTSLGQTDNSSIEIEDFLYEQGDTYVTLSPSISWTHDTLNKAIFPTTGMQQRLSGLITAPFSDLEYFKINYKHQNYFALAKSLTLRLLADIGYGDGYGDTNELPFFENYFAGGTGSVRGYKNNSLGPKDHYCSVPYTAPGPCQGQETAENPFGGSTKMVGSAELFFPVPFFSDVKSLRMGTFVDAGTVSNGFNFNELRYSTGVSGEWLSPFGALSVSAALPLNAKSGTSTDPGDQKHLSRSHLP